MNPFPAVVVGGPPHSGKSVLTYLLTQRLRELGVDHYVMRACPDGEGDWSHETPPHTVRLLRNKGHFTTTFVDLICRDLSRRHLPLIVDAGGRPTSEQERIFDHCTHAILIAPGEDGLASWRALTQRHGLVVVAELLSTQSEDESLQATTPVLRGRITGLERDAPVAGPVVAALAQRLAALFAYNKAEQRQQHLATAPTELVIEIDRLGRRFDLPGDVARWMPDQLPALLDYVPAHEPISVYGRGPGWLYAALAAHAWPALFYLWDVRLGWALPAPIMCSSGAGPDLLEWTHTSTAAYQLLDIRPREAYIDYAEMVDATMPALPDHLGLVISGKVPNWLLTSVVRQCRSLPWVAVYQPQLNNMAVIVAVRTSQHAIGETIAVDALSAQPPI